MLFKFEEVFFWLELELLLLTEWLPHACVSTTVVIGQTALGV